ncbi:hypothetical protein PFISCL1PPCAC_12986, partial [Pristionchus fissidentatus]
MMIINAILCVVPPFIIVPAFVMANDEVRKDTFELAKLLFQLLISLSKPFLYFRTSGGMFIAITLAISKHRDFVFGRIPANDVSIEQTITHPISIDAHVKQLEKNWNRKYFALRYAATYETVQRRYISFAIIATKSDYQLFLYLNRANRLRQSELLEQYNGYSVSFRWQLQQNINAAKEISILMMIIHMILCAMPPCVF